MRAESTLEGWQWWIAAAVGVGVLAWIAPHQLSVLAWIVTQLAVGAMAGYWIDRALFPHARPGDVDGDAVEARHARYRRAGLIAAGAIGATIGL